MMKIDFWAADPVGSAVFFLKNFLNTVLTYTLFGGIIVYVVKVI